MEDNPGADMEDDIFEAPSPIEMELHEDSVHAENPAQGDADSRNAQQTPPHGHDSEQGILDRSKNICFLYQSQGSVSYFTYTPSFFSFIFAAPPHLSGDISNVDEILGFFDSPPHAGNNVDEHPCEPRHTVAKRRASSRSPAPTILT
jgi:hypothetical protein